VEESYVNAYFLTIVRFKIFFSATFKILFTTPLTWVRRRQVIFHIPGDRGNSAGPRFRYRCHGRLVFPSHIHRSKIHRRQILLRDRFTSRVSPHISESSCINFTVNIAHNILKRYFKC
jgi:hypothetical protein